MGEFSQPLETRLSTAIDRGELTVQNENNASMMLPLGGDIEYVVDGSTPYRATVTETNRSIVLETTEITPQRLLARTDITVVETSELPPGTRSVMVDAIESEDGYRRYKRDAVDMDEVELAADGVLRHDGRYYVVYRGHSDDFSLLPLLRLLLWGAGGLIGIIGIAIANRARTYE